MKKIILIVLITTCWAPLAAQRILNVVDSLLVNANYERALTIIDQNLDAADPPIPLQNKKAETLIRLGHFEEAEKLLRSLLSTNESAGALAATQTNLGLLYLFQGRNDLAMESLRQAIGNYEKIDKGTALEAAQAISHLGLVYNATGKHIQADEQLQRALALRLNLLQENHELVAASYNDLGLTYYGVDNDKALSYYEKALAIYETLHGKEHPKVAIANTNIAVVYRDLELYGDAINNFESALKIWEKVYAQPHPTKAFVLQNLGETYRKMGDLKATRGYFDRALDMYQRSYGKKHPDIAYMLNALGNLELSAGEYNEALSFYQQAFRANVTDFEGNLESSNPSLRQNFYNGRVLLYSLMYKAQALEARHFGKTLRFNDLKLALATLQVCDSLIDKLRQQSSNEGDKLSLGVVASEVYADGVRIAHQASAVALNKKIYRELAFYFAEKSKSAVLLEAISDSDAKSFAGIPVNLLEEEKNLKSALALTAQKLAQKPSVEEEKSLRETSFALNQRYERFVKKLEKDFPGYYNLKFNSSSPSIGQLQKLLDAKTALLSYFIDDRNSRLYIFVITNRSYSIVNRPIPAAFDKYITGLRNGIFFNVLKSYAASSRSLTKLVLPSIPGRIRELVILPTGRLSIVPFETLLTANSKEADNDAALPFLINRYSVRYEFSAGLLLQKAKQPASRPASIFLCAPVTFPDKDNLAELPATESEVKEISQLFASKKIESSLFTGDQASEHLVKSNGLKKYSLLHFATHGVVDENDPELSRVFLQTGSGMEDGNLFAGEIYNLELDADLVTLSACQTGLGKISKGEGVIGLSRALVYAGARNIIVSFWSVADESTSLLMKQFYQRLLDNPNMGYSENLRQAKLALLKSENYAAPYYWAPFILIGF